VAHCLREQIKVTVKDAARATVSRIRIHRTRGRLMEMKWDAERALKEMPAHRLALKSCAHVDVRPRVRATFSRYGAVAPACAAVRAASIIAELPLCGQSGARDRHANRCHGGTWVVATRVVSTRELVRRHCAALGKRRDSFRCRLSTPVPPRFGGRSHNVDGSLEIDASALALRIGPLPYSFDEGLAKTAEWWRNRPR